MKINCGIILSFIALGYGSVTITINKSEPTLQWGKVTNNTNQTLQLQRKIWNQQTKEANDARTLREIQPSPSGTPQDLSIPIRWDNPEGELFADFIVQSKNMPQEQISIMFTYDASKDVLKYANIKNKQLIGKDEIKNASKQPSEINLVINGPQLKSISLQVVPLKEQPKANMEPKAKPAAAGQKDLPEPADGRPAASPDVYRRLSVPVYGTPAQILGVAPNATEQESQKAFRKLSVQYHPDKNPAGAVEFRLISWAYEQMKHGDRPTVAPFAYEALGVPINADAHQILGIAANATQQQIFDAAISLERKWPVDRNTTDVKTLNVNKLIGWAYETMAKKK